MNWMSWLLSRRRRAIITVLTYQRIKMADDMDETMSTSGAGKLGWWTTDKPCNNALLTQKNCEFQSMKYFFTDKEICGS